MRRLAIVCFYEKNGIARRYALYYLESLKAFCERVLVVANGLLTDESREKIENLGCEVFVRENTGFDFFAWKVGMERLGKAELEKYDALVLTNTTCYAPVFPLAPVFEEMESRPCDFWGITKHPKLDVLFIPNDPKSIILEHIQSYFYEFRRNVVSSEVFSEVFSEKLRNKVIAYFETKLTFRLEQAGFKSDSFVPLSLHENFIDNPMIATDLCLEKAQIPFVKRKTFSVEYCEYLNRCQTFSAARSLDFIKSRTNYDVSMIYEDMLATDTMSNLKKNLHLNFVLPSNVVLPQKEHGGKSQKTALVLYIFYPENVDFCMNYAKSLDGIADFFIISSRDDTLEKCKKFAVENFSHPKKIEFRKKENRGRDVSAYLISARDIFENYGLICAMHDKKSPQTKGIFSFDWQKTLFECCLRSKEYAQKVLQIFADRAEIGLLVPPSPCFENIQSVIGDELDVTRVEYEKLFLLLNLHVPFDENPPAPFGSCFWIRSAAAKPIFRKNWEYDDFPNEPLSADGTISHAIERIWPMVAQEAGFFTGTICPTDYAAVYFDQLT